MSIQTKSYKSKKTGKTKTKFYAVVWDVATEKAVWSKGFDTRAEAKQEEIRMEQNMASPMHGAEFKDMVAGWLKASEGVYANSTLEGYKWYLGKYIAPHFSGLIDKISPAKIGKYINDMSTKYAPETVNKVINILSNVFQYSMDMRVVDVNPMDGIKRRKVPKKNITIWENDEVRRFLEYEKVREHKYYHMLLLAFSTGMRPSEVCGVHITDLRGDILLLSKSYDRYGSLGDMKSERSHRSLQLPPHIVSALHKSAQGREIGFLFVDAAGNAITPAQISKAFKRLLRAYNKNAGYLPDTTLYAATRHSFCTSMIVDNEVPVSVVSSIVGNTERVLQSRYVHVKDTAKNEVLNVYFEKILEKKKA